MVVTLANTLTYYNMETIVTSKIVCNTKKAMNI
jgi:hypothetical protein